MKFDSNLSSKPSGSILRATALALTSLGLLSTPNANAAGVPDLPRINQKAQNGDIEAMSRLGELHAVGYYAQRSPETARRWFARGAELALRKTENCDDNCLMPIKYLAMAMETGFGGPVDKTEAASLFGTYWVRRHALSGLRLEYKPMLPSQVHRRNDPAVRDRESFSRVPLKFQEHRYNSNCWMNPESPGGFWPQPKAGARYDRELDLLAQVEEKSDWDSTQVGTMIQGAADILADCGIRVRRVSLSTHTSKCNIYDMGRSYKDRLVIKFSQNSRRASVQAMAATGWNALEIFANQGADSETLAHELGHILGEMDHPETFEPSVMHDGFLAFASPRFTARECSWIRSSKLLFPLSPARSDREIQKTATPEFMQGKEDDVYYEIQTRYEKSPHLKLFYDLQLMVQVGNPLSADIFVNTLLRQHSQLSKKDAFKVYEFHHNWRPEDGWPDERTNFRLNTPLNLYWLPGYQVPR